MIHYLVIFLSCRMWFPWTFLKGKTIGCLLYYFQSPEGYMLWIFGQNVSIILLFLPKIVRDESGLYRRNCLAGLSIPCFQFRCTGSCYHNLHLRALPKSPPIPTSWVMLRWLVVVILVTCFYELSLLSNYDFIAISELGWNKINSILLH